MSYVSPIATGVISGLGSYGYEVALNKIIEMEKNAWAFAENDFFGKFIIFF